MPGVNTGRVDDDVTTNIYRRGPNNSYIDDVLSERKS
jgi:hypothetical protein